MSEKIIYDPKMHPKPQNEMENDEFLKLVVEGCMKGWIPLNTYLRYFPEETKAAVQLRINRKIWKRGIHYAVPKGSRTWVNTIAIGQWVAADEGGAAK